MAISIERALELIYSHITPLGVELVPIENSVDRVLAENIISVRELPNFNNSAMDGYAVSLLSLGETVQIAKTIFAGDEVADDFLISKFEAVKIMTGGKIPKGVGTIIPFEDIKIDLELELQNKILIPNSLKPNSHIRFSGEDIKLNELLMNIGERITSSKIGLLASQGISHISVFKKPKIVVFATGKELKMHYEKAEPHQLYNTNSPMILAKSIELGGYVAHMKIIGDSREAVQNAIKNSLDSDLIISSGGVSVGEADFTRESFYNLGFQPIFEGVEIKPGKPTTFGKIGKTAVLNLPGNPTAGLINFELFGRAIILVLSGDSAKYINRIECETLETIKIKSGKTTAILGEFDGSTFKQILNQAPGMVKSLSNSNGFILIDKEISEIKSGSIVRFIPTAFKWFSNFQYEIISR
jgi:molybdopterin molybdotransferase